MFHITDGNASERADSFTDATEIISDWYRDYPLWATGEASQSELDIVATAIDSVPKPTTGGLEVLQGYADAIADAIAEASGVDDFAGHGHYVVRGADRLGLSLTVALE